MNICCMWCQVIGYSSPEGNASANERLSQARARRLARALSAAGVPEDVVASSGHGSPRHSGADLSAEQVADNRGASVRVRLEGL